MAGLAPFSQPWGGGKGGCEGYSAKKWTQPFSTAKREDVSTGCQNQRYVFSEVAQACGKDSALAVPTALAAHLPSGLEVSWIYV